MLDGEPFPLSCLLTATRRAWSVDKEAGVATMVVKGLGLSFVAAAAGSSGLWIAQVKWLLKSVSTRLIEKPTAAGIAPHARDIGRRKRQTGGAALPETRAFHVRESQYGTWS
jgi:phosphosulfolactate synthase (CoM biosynthesis protein A)